MLDFLRYLFDNFAQDFGFIASMIFIFKWNSLARTERYIGLLLLLSFAVDVFAVSIAFHADDGRANNIWVYNVAAPLQFFVLRCIYHQLFEARKMRRIIQAGFTIYLLLFLFNILFIQHLELFNTYSYIPACAGVAFLSYFHLRQQVEHDELPFRSFYFWFSSATLLDFVSSVPLNSLLTWQGMSTNVWSNVYCLNNIIYSIWFIIISAALLWTKRRQTSFSS